MHRYNLLETNPRNVRKPLHEETRGTLWHDRRIDTNVSLENPSKGTDLLWLRFTKMLAGVSDWLNALCHLPMFA